METTKDKETLQDKIKVLEEENKSLKEKLANKHQEVKTLKQDIRKVVHQLFSNVHELASLSNLQEFPYKRSTLPRAAASTVSGVRSYS